MKFTKNYETQCEKHAKTPKAIQAHISSKNTKMHGIQTKSMKKQLESSKAIQAQISSKNTKMHGIQTKIMKKQLESLKQERRCVRAKSWKTVQTYSQQGKTHEKKQCKSDGG